MDVVHGTTTKHDSKMFNTVLLGSTNVGYETITATVPLPTELLNVIKANRYLEQFTNHRGTGTKVTNHHGDRKSVMKLGRCMQKIS